MSLADQGRARWSRDAIAEGSAWLSYMSEASGELRAAVVLAPSEVERRLLQDRLRPMRSELW